MLAIVETSALYPPAFAFVKSGRTRLSPTWCGCAALRVQPRTSLPTRFVTTVDMSASEITRYVFNASGPTSGPDSTNGSSLSQGQPGGVRGF